MGPAFSGSAVSLRFVLDNWLESRRNIANLRFQIVSGTATAINASWLSHVGHDQATFQATVPPDDETLQEVACYIQQLGYPRTALESSVEQAGRLLRTARTVIQAADTEPGLREFFQQSIPEWKAQVQAAEAQLYKALKLQWTDPVQAEGNSVPEPIRKKHASRLKGDWRRSLGCRCRAHHALFQLMQSLIKPLEQHWLSGHSDDATPGATTFFEQAEEFVVSRVVNFLAVVFPCLQNLGYFVLVGLLLMLLAVTTYPFQPRNEFLFFNWVVILSFIGTAAWIFMQMDRDTVLSLLNGTKPGEVNFSRELALRGFLYIGAPVLALLGAQFPDSLGKIISVFTSTQGTP
jgi:hypothetical protein